MSKFVTRKWIEVNDLKGGRYSVNKKIKFKNSIPSLDLHDYSDVFFVVKGRITVLGTVDANERNKNLNFKNNVPFMSCVSKINNAFIDNAEDLDTIMPKCNSLQ